MRTEIRFVLPATVVALDFIRTLMNMANKPMNRLRNQVFATVGVRERGKSFCTKVHEQSYFFSEFLQRRLNVWLLFEGGDQQSSTGHEMSLKLLIMLHDGVQHLRQRVHLTFSLCFKDGKLLGHFVRPAVDRCDLFIDRVERRSYGFIRRMSS